MERHGLLRTAPLILIPLLLAVLLTGCGEPNDPVIPVDSGNHYEKLTVIQTQAFAEDAFVQGDELYLSQNFTDVLVYDFSNPSNPSLINTITINQEEPSVRRVGLTSESPFIAVNTSLNTQVFWKDSLNYAGYTFGSSGVLDMMVITRMDSVVLQLDYHNHSVQVFAILLTDKGDNLSMDYIWRDCVAAGDSFSSFWNSARVISQAGYYTRNPEGLAVLNGYDTLAVGLADLGVGAVNISYMFRNDVEWLSIADTPGEATHLTKAGDYLYVADGAAGLAIIDASNPIDLQYVKNFDTDGLDHAIDIAISGKYLALLDQYDGVLFFDISDPVNPEFMDMYVIREPTSVSIVDNNIVLITSVEEGLAVLELKY